MPEDKTEPEKPENKFSRVTTFIGAIAALIGAMMPITAAINGWYGVKVEREKFLSQMRLSFLDRALDPTKSAAYRESIIRYLLESIEPSDPLYKWAYNQVAVADEIRKLEKKIASLDLGLKNAGVELGEVQERSNREKSVASARERELQKQIASAKQERLRLEHALRDAEAKIGRPSVVRQETVTSLVPKNPKPQVFRADAELRGKPFGSANLIIMGSGFGSKPGHLYIIVNPGGTEVWKPLKAWSWNDSTIEATIDIPPNWESRQDMQDIYIGVTTDDSRASGPIHVAVSAQLAPL